MERTLDEIVLAPWVSGWGYLWAAVLGSALIRIVPAMMRAWRAAVEDKVSFLEAFTRIYRGLGPSPFPTWIDPKDRELYRGDYLSAALVGVLELVAYPFLLKATLYPYVGAWIGLKVVAQYDAWKSDRGTFTQFLIGNALILIVSFLFAQTMLVSMPGRFHG